jgi:hypothetical protein
LTPEQRRVESGVSHRAGRVEQRAVAAEGNDRIHAFAQPFARHGGSVRAERRAARAFRFHHRSAAMRGQIRGRFGERGSASANVWRAMRLARCVAEVGGPWS